MTYTLSDLPGAGVRAMLSEAIDHNLSNCAGLLAGQAFRGIFRRSWLSQSAWDSQLGTTHSMLSVDAAIVPGDWAIDTRVEITLGEGVGTYRITEVHAADGGRSHVILERAA